MHADALQVAFTRLIVFRNSPFGVDAKAAFGEPAQYTGRFHRKGEPLPLYSADSFDAALREHELHTAEPLHPPREVLRRVSAIAVAAGSVLLVADHVAALETANLSLEDLNDATDYTGCHRLTDLARRLPGVIGITTQSNADRPQRTITIFPEHVSRLTDVIEYWEGSLNLLKMAPVNREMLAQPSG